MALDIYAWLAYRLHALKVPVPISWTALKGQFGVGYGSVYNFRYRFEETLKLALAVYREAKVDVTERSLTLMPSKPPVSPRQIAAGRGT